MSHQGWKNYETWAIALWLNNEEPSYRYWNNAAQEVLDDAEDKDDARRALADRLKNEHEEAKPEIAGVWSDLLSAALGEVDWFEVADDLLEDKSKDEQEERV